MYYTVCKRISHKEDQCCFKKKTQKPHKQKEKLIANTTALKKEAHVAKVGTDEEMLVAIGDDQNMNIDNSLFDNIYNYNVHYANLAFNKDYHIYDWLADSGSTNHISNWCEIFSSYKPTPEATVYGVGDKITYVIGCGTVLLTTQYGTQKHTLCLENGDYIPTNKYNIFTLGR
jgi:hypothetical protein